MDEQTLKTVTGMGVNNIGIEFCFWEKRENNLSLDLNM
jgi:hypothetical protein